MFCKYCGMKIPNDSLFCTACGKSQRDLNGGRPPATNPPEQKFSLQFPAVASPAAQPVLEQEKEVWEKSSKPSRKKAVIVSLAIVALVAAVGLFVWFQWLGPSIQYHQAVSMLDNGEYDEAQRLFSELGDYQNSPVLETNARYLKACDLIREKDYVQAESIFRELGDYKDSANRAEDCVYQNALVLLEQGKFEESKALFQELNKEEEYQEKYVEHILKQAKSAGESGELDNALKLLKEIPDNKEAKSLLELCTALKPYQGTWEDKEYGFTQIIFKGTKIYHVYFPDTNRAAVNNNDAVLKEKGKIGDSIFGSTFSIKNNELIQNSDTHNNEHYKKLSDSTDIPK